jgi:hypothetical protein
MRIRGIFVLVGRLTVAAWLMLMAARGDQPVEMKIQAPEFELGDKADEWINVAQAKPLKLKDLRGQVVVVHYWTFG